MAPLSSQSSGFKMPHYPICFSANHAATFKDAYPLQFGAYFLLPVRKIYILYFGYQCFSNSKSLHDNKQTECCFCGPCMVCIKWMHIVLMVSVHLFQLQNHWMYFNKIWNGQYATGGYSKLTIFNFL